MKAKTLIIAAVLSTSLTAPCLGAATYNLSPFTPGDTTVEWLVTGSLGGTGVLTATTNDPSGFLSAGGTSAFLTLDEVPASDVFWSFTGNQSAVSTLITHRLQSLAVGNVFNFSQVGTVTQNEGDNYFKDPGLTTVYLVGDTLGAVYSNNAVTDFRFTSTQFGTMSFTGGAPAGFILISSMSFDIIPIPEPSGVALLGVGSVAFLLRRRR